MARFTTGDYKVIFKEANMRLYTSWTEDKLIFPGADATEVVRRIERTFGVDVIVSQKYKDERVTGTIRSDNLDVLTQALGKILHAEIPQQGKRLQIGTLDERSESIEMKQKRMSIMKKFVLRITELILLLLVGGAVNTELMAQQESYSPILVSNADATDGHDGTMVSLADFLTTLEQNFEATFLFKDEVVHQKMVDTNKIQMEEDTGDQLAAILDQLGLTYYQVNEQTYVLLSKKTLRTKSAAQEQISGTVTDGQSGETLPGVNILVKGTSTGASTDSEGEYELTVESLQDTLVASYIGYQTKEVPIQGRTTVDVALQSQVVSGEEMVVVGYGTQKKENLTTSVSSIDAEDLENTKVSGRLDQALKGKIAGAHVQQYSGQPGQAPFIRIRGVSSITAGNSPLWVIDGLPIQDESIIANLNLSNIESMDVLKGPAATSIYGSRGTNGVITITTKKGRKGKIEFNVSAKYGWQGPEKTVDYLNGPEFVDYVTASRDNAYVEDGGSLEDPMSARPFKLRYPPKWDDPDYKAPTYDYQDLIFRDAANTMNYSVSGSGGFDSGTFFASGSYTKNEGVVRRTNFERISARLNTDFNITDYMELNVVIVPSRSSKQLPHTFGKGSPFQRALKAPQVFSPFTGFPGKGIPLPNYRFQYPYDRNGLPVLLYKEDEQVQNQLLSKAELSLDILPKLQYKIKGGFTYIGVNRDIFNPSTITEISNEQPIGRYANTERRKSELDQTLQYEDSFKKVHNLSVLLGFTAEKYNYHQSNISGHNFPSDLVKTLNAAGDISGSTNAYRWTLLSYLGRINYNYDNRYSINFNIRRDGSSKFGKNNQWGLFPSVSGAWNIANEEFFQSDLISQLKLRASYGKMGNNQIGNYQSQSVMNITHAVYQNGGSLQTGYYPSNLGNQNLTWETSKSYNIGVDIGMLDGRFSMSMDAYKKKTDGLLLNVQLPSHSGFNSQLTNIGEVVNRGFEVQLTSRNIVGNFDWTTSGNIALNENEVKQLGPKNSPLMTGAFYGNSNRTAVGHPIGSFYILKQIGTWNTQEEIENNPHWKGSKPGDPRLEDTNGDGEVNQDDRSFQGRVSPLYTFGIRNKFQYNNFDLSIFFEGSGGNKILNVLAERAYGKSNTDHINKFGYWRDFWKGPEHQGGKYTPEPNANVTGAQGQFTDRGLFDASYIRLKNITLGYNFPVNIMEKLPSISKIRIYAQGTNLWLHDHATYSYLPEAYSESGGDPLSAAGYDYVSYPLARQFSIGLDVSF